MCGGGGGGGIMAHRGDMRKIFNHGNIDETLMGGDGLGYLNLVWRKLLKDRKRPQSETFLAH
jgi:hypothetical protein